MGHGLYRNTEDNSIYLNDFEYYSHPQFRANIIREILQKSSNSLL